MIIQGASRSNSAQAVWYLLEKDRGEKETSRLVDVKGTISQNVEGAALEWEAIAAGTRCKEFVYHISINLQEGEHLTPEQWTRAVEHTALRLGLENNQRIVVEHQKEGRGDHQHVIFNRIDPEKGKAVNMGHDYAKRERSARELEKEFGLEPVKGRLFVLDGAERADRQPKDSDKEQAKRNGVNLKQWRVEIRDIVAKELETNPDATGHQLAAALEDKGHMIAKGDKVALVILDPSGTPQRMAQSLDLKIGKGDFAAFFGDIDPETLPNVEQAKELQKARGFGVREQEQPAADERKAGRAELKAAAELKIKEASGRAVDGFDFIIQLHNDDLQVARNKWGQLAAVAGNGFEYSLKSVDPTLKADIAEQEKGGLILPTTGEVREQQKQTREERRAAWELQKKEYEEKRQKSNHRKGATLYSHSGMASQQKDAMRHIRDKQKEKQREERAEQYRQKYSRPEQQGQTRDNYNAKQQAARDEQQRQEPQQGQTQSGAIGKEKGQAAQRGEERQKKTEMTAEQIRQRQKEISREIFERTYGKQNTATLDDHEKTRGGRERER